MHFVICCLYIVSKSCDRNKLLLSSRCQSSFGLSTKSIRKLAKTHCEIIRLAAVRKLSGSQIERFVSAGKPSRCRRPTMQWSRCLSFVGLKEEIFLPSICQWTAENFVTTGTFNREKLRWVFNFFFLVFYNIIPRSESYITLFRK